MFFFFYSLAMESTTAWTGRVQMKFPIISFERSSPTQKSRHGMIFSKKHKEKLSVFRKRLPRIEVWSFLKKSPTEQNECWAITFNQFPEKLGITLPLPSGSIFR